MTLFSNPLYVVTINISITSTYQSLSDLIKDYQKKLLNLQI